MQRCPYIHEMRERLLGQPTNSMAMEAMMQREGLIDGRQSDNQVGTVVKVGRAMLVSKKKKKRMKNKLFIFIYFVYYHESCAFLALTP